MKHTLIQVQQAGIQGVDFLSGVDPRLGAVIEAVGEFNLRPTHVPTYQALIKAIVSQQLNGKAASSIYNRFTDLFSGKGFPAAQEINSVSVESLRGVGLSKAKAAYIKNVVAAELRCEIPSLNRCHSLNDSEIIDILTKLKGVGHWSAQMVLIFNLGRLDVLPAADLGIRRGFGLTYEADGVPGPEEVEAFSVRWKPFRTIASWYLWRALDTLVNDLRT